MKGAFNTRPPRPKYTETWDVDQVLQYLITLGSNVGLSLKNLTLKLAMLMALVIADRSHKLSSHELSLMQDWGNVVTFTIAKFTENGSTSY